MFTETITWLELPADGFPDSDTTVLVLLKGDPEVTEGFHDGEVWRSAADALRFRDEVLRWADLPGSSRTTHNEDKQEQGDARKHGLQPGALAAGVGTRKPEWVGTKNGGGFTR